MSEYQYYEFQAIDRPLTKQEMAEVRALSTRATITSTRFVNTYEWGNFKGDPLTLMKRYYDAFLYVANWGSHRLMLRVPRSSLAQETVLRYIVQDGPFSLHIVKGHLILAFDSETEEPEDRMEDEGWTATLVPLRAALAGGDLRALYLGWLLCVQEDLLDDDVVEPPVPPGMGELSASLHALVDFLRLDEDLLQSAAESSPPMPRVTPSPKEARQWVDVLSNAEKEALLLRLAASDLDARLLQAEVRRRIWDSGVAEGARAGERQGRTVGELLDGMERRQQERERRVSQERERRRQEEADAQAVFLDRLAGRQEEVWRKIEALVDTRRPTEYAEAIRLLKNLRDLAEREHQAEAYASRLMELRTRHAKKVSLLDRLNQAGLRPGWTLSGGQQER
ncbi:MAG: hypothetical protein HY681_02410 [Chloroflexi bacterium]|nr:hypothetical protein [Chloroflexota bacterium]